MTSKAERKRAKRSRQPLGSSNAGRPRQEGERYPSGKLKPRKNERLLEAKRALVGKGMDIALADDPLDFIHAKGWLSTPRYRAALAYRDARSRANVGGPRLDGGGVQETASTTGVDARPFAHMTDADITAVFDHVFREAPRITAEEREALAMQKWKRLEGAMIPAQRCEVHLICVQQSWGWWITALNAGKALTGSQAQAKANLEAGLDAMRAAMRVKEQAEAVLDRLEALPAPRPRKVEHDVRFVDEDGEAVEMASARGKPFQVGRKVRVPGQVR